MTIAVEKEYEREIDQLRQRLDKAANEILRLRKGIQDYLDGDYGRDYFRTVRDKCPHGLFRWESCENCIDAHFAKLISPAERVTPSPPASDQPFTK